MRDGRRTLVAVLISVILVATAIASLWLMASAGVFSAGGSQLPNAPVVAGGADPAIVFPAGGRARIYQPRDPFEPLVSAPPTTEGGDGFTSTSEGETTTTTLGDGSSTTSTTGDGSTTSTSAGTASTTSTTAGTTTTAGDQPVTARIALLEVREEQGIRRAVVTVDGETFTVGVGDQFGDDLKVVSLSATGGVFQIGDRVFSLAVGQSILK